MACYQFVSDHDLFIPGNGVTYACRNGIIHYIACHGYQPPAVSCEAVLNCPAPDPPEFFAALQANGWPEARPTEHFLDEA